MRIKDFISLCVDTSDFSIVVFNLEKDDPIYCGSASDLPKELDDREVESFFAPEVNGQILFDGNEVIPDVEARTVIVVE